MALALPILAAALAAQLLPAPGAVQWELVADETDGRTSIDAASLGRDGDVVHFVVRTELSATQDDGVRALNVRMAVDCRRRTMGIEAADAYGQDGHYIGSREAEQISFQPLGTTPSHESLYRRVCPSAAASAAPTLLALPA